MEVTLSDKKKIAIDLYKITIKQYESMFIDGVTEDEKKAVMCKTFGMTPGEFDALPMPDGVRLQKAFWDAAKDPLKDPNSESVSSSA